ncbi:MAG: hypothetical protein JW922_10045 [Paludibacteraceae bacterium]|nr:hypothetical protein [Paludibacteraceae bacterium]
MKKHLFTDFLTNKLVYQICKNYWEIKIEDLLFKHGITAFSPYLNTKFANGQDFNDGNPIVNLYDSKQNRAFRIIQEEPESENESITAWTNKTEINDIEIEELVISLELTPTTENIALDLISKWLITNSSANTIEKYVEYIKESISTSPAKELIA